MQQTEQMCHLARNLEFKVKVDKSDLYRIAFWFYVYSPLLHLLNDCGKWVQFCENDFNTSWVYKIFVLIFSLSQEIPLISASRFLVKQGELTRLVTDSTSRFPLGKRASSKQPVYIYLFNDLLIVTKRKKWVIRLSGNYILLWIDLYNVW